MTVPGPIATLLEMAALNNGFDHELSRDEEWLGFASTQAPLKIWLRNHGDADYIAAVSLANVSRALGEHGQRVDVQLPIGAVSARLVESIPAMHRLLRRAFQLSKTLPDELLHTFEKATANLPRATEVERLVVMRVGQDLFRAGLMEYWEGRCAVTGLSISELLRASHIKPWAACTTDAERLDVFNGILLGPNLDAAFDRGFITIGDDGGVIVSMELSAGDQHALGLVAPLRVAIADGHKKYLVWHRENLFKMSAPRPP